MNIIQVFISIILYFVLFFGISFILNMILKMTWIMAFVYPIIVILIIDRIDTIDYIRSPGTAFSEAIDNIVHVQFFDVVILASGFIGIILAGLTIRYLRKLGYQMF
ncbi:YuiB family protein [Nosocomiicoccus ampullae]|uniref:YuiB family protein n=1 Tax=Nosocomiicoccus ampullae TaxID=489910 RepID=UPI00214E9356|nr:YuiB family protein [Nosocomiicoccus ampullae]